MQKVLVAGATGYLGQYVVAELKKRGYWVRVLIRKEIQKKLFSEIAVDEFFLGEVTKSKSIENITRGIDWVFSSIGITRQKDGLSYLDVDYQGNLNLLREAEKTKVDLFEYVSVLGAEKIPHLDIIKAKEKFVKALEKSKIPKHCIIRPSGFFSDLREVLLMAKRKKMYLIGDGENKINPISGTDLAVVCVDTMEEPQAVVAVGGPKIYTQNDIANIAFEALDLKPKIVHVPLWVRDVVVFGLRVFTWSKFNGPILFFLTAITLDMSAPKYGEELLEDYYKNEARWLS